MADHHGHCLYLGERECSVQRRHQKVIEEAPSPVVGEDLRRRMGEAAVKLAVAAGYTNAGTVEFLVDAAQNFYFLEMNTRLQVEHPVTEMVTGLDLVHMQLLVAEGWPLPIAQKDVHLRGHAIECRIYAEDPANNFFPSPGLITRLIQPAGPGIREDCAIYSGWRVPLDYDPMLSKLIAFAPTREVAIDRMLRALDEYVIGGIATNISFFREILTDAEFRAARIDTSFLDHLLAKPRQPESASVVEGIASIAALVAAVFEATSAPPPTAQPLAAPTGAWKSAARNEALRG
jgi:acetyl-CoA carboxylase biotin carboxylase subunit